MPRRFGYLRMLVVAGLVSVFASTALAVNIETVPVGNPGNQADLRYHIYERPEGYGRVDYVYQIGKFEVTAGQYCEFLNAVAKTDTYRLFNDYMADPRYFGGPSGGGCNIQRSGLPGSYTYSVAPDWANRPVNWTNWGDAARFANWMHNGQPSGPQNASTTEDGSYYLMGENTNFGLRAVTRKANATWVIPSEDEWYKAAHYDPVKAGGAGYWEYPTRSDAMPSNVLNPTGTNNANFPDVYGIGYTIGAPYYRTEVGAFAGSPGPYGTFDQGGNMWEWDEAVLSSLERSVRGGACYGYSGVYMRAAVRYGYGPADEDNYIGFRLAHVPEPATLGLMALTSVGILRRRRRQCESI